MVDGNPLKADGSDDQSQAHELNRAKQDSAASSTIDEQEVDKGEDEVGARNDGSHGHGVGKSNKREDDWRIVHEGIETGELGDGHQATGRYQGAEVGTNNVELLEHPPLRLAGIQGLGLLYVVGNVLDLVLDLLLGTVGEDFSDDIGGLLHLAMVYKLSRRLGAERKKTGEDEGRQRTSTNHVSPTTGNMGKASSNAVAHELATGNRHVIETNHTATVLRRGHFGNVPVACQYWPVTEWLAEELTGE